jgi:EmrB/QacA subfamily drug resistance transporter
MTLKSTAALPPDVSARAERRKYWVLGSIGLGSFMAGLDSSIVNTLLPVMADSLRASVARIEWVLTIYLLVVSGMLLGVGRLGDLRGHKNVYLTGFVGFTVSSGLCGLAPTAAWLIVFRALQAGAGAMLFANAPAILTSSFPATERGRALGLQGTMTYLGLAAGPPLGGILAAYFGWRSIFFVNVPVGLLGTYFSYRNIARDRPKGEVPPFDFAGAALFFIGLFALLLALNQGHSWGWTAPLTLTILIVALLLLGVFIALERRRAHPMLDLSLFRQRVFTGSVFSAMMNYTANTAIFFVLPFYLIQGRGFDPKHAGTVLTALPVLMMITTPIAGTLSDRVGSRGPTVLGMFLLAVGLFFLSAVGPETPMRYVAGALAVCGVGIGAFVSPNNSRLLGAAPLNRRGIASGVLAAARNVGMVLGVGLAGAVYTTMLARTGGRGIFDGVSASLKVVAVISLVGMATSWLEGEAPGEQAAKGHRAEL